MKANPRFSLLVANFNNRSYLEAMLESVLGQTYANWELIVVDDGSTDGSRDVLRAWTPRDPRISILEHASNRGVGAAFSNAAASASGEILGMLGADDALRSDAIEMMVEAHGNHSEASLINSDLVMCDENLKPLAQHSPYGPLPPGETLIRNCPISSFATFKRVQYARTAGFDPSFKRAVDHDLYLKLEEVGSLAYVPEPLYLYRTHSGGISQGDNGIRAAQSALLARGNAYGRRLGTGISNLTQREYREMMSIYHRREAELLDSGERFGSLRHLGKSAAYRPLTALKPSFWNAAVHHLLAPRR